jgi:hypothetical protein
MNPLIVLKLLDLAMIGFTAYEKYQSQQAMNAPVSDKLAMIRKKILLGEMSYERAAAEIEEVTNAVIERRHKAFDALPTPGHQ